MSDEPILALSQRLALLERRLSQTEVAETGPNWGAAAGRHTLLPELRGFWPFSTIGSGGSPAVDFSGRGNNLSNNGSATRAIYADLVPYTELNGSSQYWSIGDNTELSITGALTWGGWYWFDTIATTSALANKWNGTGNQRSYLLLLNSSTIEARVSSNGTAETTVVHTTAPQTGRWHHIVGRYVPSAELSVFLDGVETLNTTSIPASIFDSTADFRVGVLGSGANFLDGRAALQFVCADDLPDALIQGLHRATKLFFQ